MKSRKLPLSLTFDIFLVLPWQFLKANLRENFYRHCIITRPTMQRCLFSTCCWYLYIYLALAETLSSFTPSLCEFCLLPIVAKSFGTWIRDRVRRIYEHCANEFVKIVMIHTHFKLTLLGYCFCAFENDPPPPEKFSLFKTKKVCRSLSFVNYNLVKIWWQIPEIFQWKNTL